jgi:hypothetical protein
MFWEQKPTCPQEKKLKLSTHPQLEVCTLTKQNNQNVSLWPIYIGFDSTTFNTNYGIKCAAIVNNLWNTLRI